MARRRYAQKTMVAVVQSRGEIDKLLRQWGCDMIQWTDEFDEDRVTLRFVWNHDDRKYMARFSLGIEPIDMETVQNYKTGGVAEGKLAKAQANRGKQEHRLLLLWLKAALNAVDANLIDAATLFLPFLEDSEGRTVAEVALPRLAQLPGGTVKGLLGA